MTRYEVLFLTVPEITGDEVSTIEKNVEQEIKKRQGSVISFDRWGKCRLAYPIRHHEYGVYFLVRFEGQIDQKTLQDLNNVFAVRHNETVMRNIIRRLDGTSLEYKRPESVEETPARDVDSFLRENQMEGLVTRRPGRSHDFAAETNDSFTAQEEN